MAFKTANLKGGIVLLFRDCTRKPMEKKEKEKGEEKEKPHWLFQY